MAANLLINPSFEADLNADGLADGWTSNSVATTERSLVPGLFGQRAQRIKVSGQATGGDSRVLLQLTSAGSFSTGESASISVYAKGAFSGCTIQWAIMAYSSTAFLGSVNITNFPGLPANAWKLYKLTYANLPVNTSFVRFDVRVFQFDTGDSFDVAFDGAKLEKSVYATPFATAQRPRILSGIGGIL